MLVDLHVSARREEAQPTAQHCACHSASESVQDAQSLQSKYVEALS